MNYKDLAHYGDNLNKAIQTVDQKDVDRLYEELFKRLNGQSEIYLVGNGGSAANAHHIAGDYSKTFSTVGKRLKISNLSDNLCYLTAAANDFDYTQIYEILINTRVIKNDLIIFLSGSGNSMNLIKAARKAKKAGIKTSCLVGYNGGALKKLVNMPIHFLIDDMEIAEDCQISLFHFIKQKLIMQDPLIEKEKSSKYFKRTNNDLIA